MSYTPTNWQTGDTITAEKLNKLENGVAGGGGGAYVVNAATDADTQFVTLDKTFLEVETAYLAGKSVIIYYTELTNVDNIPLETYYKNFVVEVYRSGDANLSKHGISIFTNYNIPSSYYADSLDGYPYYDPDY